MRYLTFDSNIWIYLLDDAYKEYNPLDHIEHWIDSKQIEILLPQIILTEWENNKNAQRQNRERDLKEFFQKARDIIPSAFIETQRNPANIKLIVDNQLDRIETLLREKARIIELTTGTSARVIQWGINKKAPMHKKSSVADAIIVLSLFEFAKDNPDHQYFFISTNTEDFCYKENRQHHLHPDLQPEFDANKIQYYKNLDLCVQDLKGQLLVTVDFEHLKKQRIKHKIEQQVFNPALLKTLGNRSGDYLQNIDQLDTILKKSAPTSEQIMYVLGLFDSDRSYKEYFYKTVKERVWFPILKDQGEFYYANNPAMIKVGDLFQATFWEPLLYIENVSLTVKEEGDAELIAELFDFIRNVSLHPKDNQRTWFMLMKILTNLPNKDIPLSILHLIPIWFSGLFKTTLESLQLCTKLLPKFLNEAPTTDDIEKAEYILTFLFQLYNQPKNNESGLKVKYYSLLDLHQFADSLDSPGIIARIVKYCSEKIVLHLTSMVKLLLLDFPNGVYSKFKSQDNTYTTSLTIDVLNLSVKISDHDNNVIAQPQLIEKFEHLEIPEIQRQLQNIIQDAVPAYESTDDFEDPLIRIKFLMNGDIYGTLGTLAIHEIEREYYKESLREIFALVLRDLLVETTDQNASQARRLLESLCFDGRYKMPFFKRITLFLISHDWLNLKSLFWKLIENKDTNLLFSESRYNKDLYHLLNKVAAELTSEEHLILLEIIEQGNQLKEDDQSYWKLNWYAALRDIEPFKSHYVSLSAALKITHKDFENSGKLRISSANVSPFSKEAILAMQGQEIVDYISSFRPERHKDEITVSGMASAIGEATKQYPDKFAEEIHLYSEVHFIYTYYMLLGFRDAWKSGRIFDWQKVLIFFLAYIDDPRFQSGEFKLANDGWGIDSNLLTGALADLLTEGMHDERRAMNNELSPLVKALLIIMVPRLQAIDDYTERGMDYPMYSLNSTSGKVLRALLIYSLFRIRGILSYEDTGKWEPEIKKLFEEAQAKQILDTYILQGWHFEQFCYLDKDWMVEQVEAHASLNEKEWRAFMGGFAYVSPPSDLGIYQLLYPHYIRAADLELDFNEQHDEGLIRHLVSFYFWGFENLKTERLLVKYLKERKPSALTKLIQFISRQEEYMELLDEAGKANLEKIIIELWQYIIQRFPEPSDAEEIKLIADLAGLITFCHYLDDVNTPLLIQSAKRLPEKYFSYELVNDLHHFRNKGESLTTAKHLSEILSVIPFNVYMVDAESTLLTDLIRFLYENDQKKAANDICNGLSRAGHEFVKNLFKEFND
jgi:hypothetical protein